jgi:hypothetical protein
MSDRNQSLRLSVQHVALLALAFVACQGCAAPVFSDFQTARVVQQGEWELTPAVSHLPTLDQTNAGLQAAVGMGSNIELRARYVRAFTRDVVDENDTRFFNDLNADFNTASLGVKFSLAEGVLAAYVPVEAVFAAGSETALTTRPTLIATVPLTDFAEVNTSVNVILPYGLVSVNAGLGIGKLGTWSFRPEAGVMLNTGYVAAGIGVAYRFGGPVDGP